MRGKAGNGMEGQGMEWKDWKWNEMKWNEMKWKCKEGEGGSKGNNFLNNYLINSETKVVRFHLPVLETTRHIPYYIFIVKFIIFIKIFFKRFVIYKKYAYYQVLFFLTTINHLYWSIAFCGLVSTNLELIMNVTFIFSNKKFNK